jgi:hypothetical protein
MLKMKQTMQATDKLRAEQTTNVCTTVNSIIVAMHDLSACISNAVTNCQKVPDSVASSLTETMKNGLNSLENRVQFLENITRQRGTANASPNTSVRSPVPNTYNISPRATHPMYPIHAFPMCAVPFPLVYGIPPSPPREIPPQHSTLPSGQHLVGTAVE